MHTNDEHSRVPFGSGETGEGLTAASITQTTPRTNLLEYFSIFQEAQVVWHACGVLGDSF